MMRCRAVALVLLASFVVASCGIGDDAGPRDIPQASQHDLSGGTDLVGGEATGTGRIYLIAPTGAGRSTTLQPVARNVPEQPVPVLESLFSGPNADELSKQFRSAIPVGTRLLTARPQGTTLKVDVSKDLLQLSGDDLVDALAQIVFTASELDQVQSVQILVEGVGQQWPAGNGELQTAPLTVYDFPGRVATSQPAYPAFPTPIQP
jgi:predicted small secreted protein